MLKSRYYIGYYNDIALCSSTKKKAVKSYLEDNRKLSSDQYDIIESFRAPIWHESNCELIEYCKRYVTVKEYRIIMRDFKNFMDDAYTTYNNLHDMLNISTSSSDRRALKSTLYIYEELFNPDNEISDPALIETVENFFKSHDLVNMNMQAYLAKLAAFPNYFEC